MWIIPPPCLCVARRQVDVLEEGPLRFLPAQCPALQAGLVSAEAVAVEHFAFYCGEEILAHRVVKAVSDQSCGGTDTGPFAAQTKGE